MPPLAFWAWLVVAAVCAVYELFGAKMLSLPFALGALAAAVAVFVGAAPGWQWAIFFGVTFAALVALSRWWAQDR